MSKGKNRSSKKGAAAKRPAISKKPTQVQARAPVSQRPEERASLELFGTSLAVLVLALLLSGYVFSDPTRGTSMQAWEHARMALAGWRVQLPVSAKTWTAWTHAIHRFTSACFFLSGARNSTVSGALWERFSMLWSSDSRKYERSPYDICFAVTWGLVLLVVRIYTPWHAGQHAGRTALTPSCP